ncbi:MAG: DUF4339 domain-containing protein [Phycisphaerae bacterium]|jgi:hypothetical protein
MDERLWYYAMNQQQCGPVGELEILRLINSRNIGPQTYVWTDGFTDWQQASQVSRFAPLFQNSQLRPASVTVFGILNIVFGSLGLICTPFSLALIFVMPEQQNITEITKLWLIIGSALGFCLNILLLTLGIGLLRLKASARKWLLVYGWFTIFWVIVATVINTILILSGQYGYAEQQMASALGGACGGLVGGLAYPILLIIFMMRKPAKDSCVK